MGQRPLLFFFIGNCLCNKQSKDEYVNKVEYLNLRQESLYLSNDIKSKHIKLATNKTKKPYTSAAIKL